MAQGLPDLMDIGASPGAVNLELPQAASTSSASTPSSRINRLPTSPLTTELASANESSVELESSLEDVSKEHLLDSFLSEGCGCVFGPNSTQCCQFLERFVISKCIQDCLELERNELDLVVLSCIHSHLSFPDHHMQRVSHHPTSMNSQARSEYFICGVRVCRNTFLLHMLSYTVAMTG